MKSIKGILNMISGPVVTAQDIYANMYDLVRVGNEQLLGEIIQIKGENVIIQVYEDTSNLKPGDPVVNTGRSLSVELGPGLLSSIYDGVQRPLPVLIEQMGNFIKRGVYAPGLDRKKKWEFNAVVKQGDIVKQGDFIGEVEETDGIFHKIMLPIGINGKIKEINSGNYTVEEVIGSLEDGTELKLKTEWPIRKPRPYNKKLIPKLPLITGQRVFDVLFPLVKGGVAAIPGPFGAGKTVSQQQLAKWSDA
ncbi:MAG: V-type ATP synthase subunit A, partial [Nanoarchaeota archaeon]